MELEWKQDAKDKAQKTPFTSKDWIALIAILALSAMIIYGFDNWSRIPGLGMTVFCWAGTGLAVWRLREMLRVSHSAIFMVVCALLLAVTYALYANEEMRILNLPVLVSSLLAGLYALAGGSEALPDGPRHLVSLAGRAVADSIRYINKPFQGIASLQQKQNKHLKSLGLGLIITLPVLVFALGLMSSADEVFSAGLSGFLQGLRFLSVTNTISKALLTLALALVLFSLLWGFRHPIGPAWRKSTVTLPILSGAMLLGTLIIAYVAFVWVQVNYLFGGASSASMAGGWAQYARKGFFELAAIGALNISVMAFTLPKGQCNLLLRILNGLLIVLTALILLSATRRMVLYIQFFGLSLLRLLTLWAMAMILIALIGFTVRLTCPETRLFRPLATLALAAWVALNLLSPAALVAKWNADAFTRGSLKNVDTGYLVSLGADTLPALRRLSEGGYSEADEALHQIYRREPTPWYAWSLAELHLNNVKPDNVLPSQKTN